MNLEKLKDVIAKSGENETNTYADIIVFYHDNCADGFTSAWVVNKFFRDQEEPRVEYHGVVYSKPIKQDYVGKIVIFVDFCHNDVSVMLDVFEKAYHTFVLDHHKTAIENMLAAGVQKDNVDFIFDIERSGAGITFDFFFPNESMPALVEIVQHRDLWHKNHPDWEDIKAFNANIFSYEYTFKNWDLLNAMPVNESIKEGRAIYRKHMKDIRELLTTHMHYMRWPIDTLVCPSANLSYMQASEAGELMCQMTGAGFAACYTIQEDVDKYGTKVIFSLRSPANGGMDVAALARKFGGGGHKNAAGFTIPYLNFKTDFRFVDLRTSKLKPLLIKE